MRNGLYKIFTCIKVYFDFFKETVAWFLFSLSTVLLAIFIKLGFMAPDASITAVIYDEYIMGALIGANASLLVSIAYVKRIDKKSVEPLLMIAILVSAAVFTIRAIQDCTKTTVFSADLLVETTLFLLLVSFIFALEMNYNKEEMHEKCLNQVVANNSRDLTQGDIGGEHVQV